MQSASSFERKIKQYQQSSQRKTRRQNRTGRWLGYAAVGSAAATSPAVATAAIVHVVPPSPIMADVDDRFARLVDLDNDGAADLAFGAGNLVTGNVFHVFYGIAEGYGGAKVVAGNATLPEGKRTVRRFSLGNVIAPFNAGSGAVLRTSLTIGGITQGSLGEWGIQDTAFAGIQLTSSRAGWLKIRTRPLGNRLEDVELLAWAYQTVPNTPIVAGDDGTGATLLGDYNGNGSLGVEDYNVWRSRFGQTANPPGSGADGNGDGRVNAADYSVWRNQMASGAGADANLKAVPEAGTVTLGMLALGAAGVAALRRTKH